jgi:succinate-semialdehyde dehydrogenase/glutarate-semialdehyde dehydrogenase
VEQLCCRNGCLIRARILVTSRHNNLTKPSLELGGNAPFIVFDDADIDAAVDGAMIAKFRNNGQTCVCANRFYVQTAAYDLFVEKLKLKVETVSVGNGFETGITIGPLINAAALTKVETHIADAVAKGAAIAAGGGRTTQSGTFFAPTLIQDVTPDMLICHEETFGPVAAIVRFETEAEVLQMANDSEFGLAAYFYSRDLTRAWRVAEALETGMVGINTGLISTEVAPFGGIKQSGLGREGSKYGIEDFLEIKNVCFGGIA